MLSRMAPSSPPVKRTLHLLKTPDILCANDSAGELVFKYDNGTAEGDDNHVEGKHDAGPQMNLEERPAQPKLARAVNQIVEERHRRAVHWLVWASYQPRMRV